MMDVRVPKEEYDELVADSKLLAALFAAGVDNWEGFEFVEDA